MSPKVVINQVLTIETTTFAIKNKSTEIALIQSHSCFKNFSAFESKWARETLFGGGYFWFRLFICNYETGRHLAPFDFDRVFFSALAGKNQPALATEALEGSSSPAARL